MALIVDSTNVGYNVQEICNRLDTLSRFTSSFNAIQKIAADAAASTTTAETVIAYLKTGQTLSRLVIIPTGALTAHDTTYATITIAKRSVSAAGAAGNASTIIALTTKITGGSGDWLAFKPIDMGTLTGGAVAAESVLTWTVAKASTGVQIPALCVFAEFS